MTTDAEHASSSTERTTRAHVRAGLVALAVFVALGALLEGFHAYKTPLYLDAGNETRRLLLRLAHAHGALIAIVHVAYGLVVNACPRAASPIASASLFAALVLVPLGFLLGGAFAAGADPGAGILLVPPGAVALALGLVVAAKRV